MNDEALDELCDAATRKEPVQAITNSRIAAACYPPYITQDFDFVYTISLNNSTRSESDTDHNEFLLSMKRNLV